MLFDLLFAHIKKNRRQTYSLTAVFKENVIYFYLIFFIFTSFLYLIGLLSNKVNWQ
jgi:hypothetical protein